MSVVHTADEAPSAISVPNKEPSRRLQHWSLALLLVGIAWRLVRYFLRFPIMGDEAFVCLNFFDQDYQQLTGPLRFAQVAPFLFLWGERAALLGLGSSEFSLRLFPLLAGLGGLLLFWRLAHLTLPPLARTLAIGFLAVAIWPVSMCSLVKPYSFDLLMSCALLVPAAEWLRKPERCGWLLLLAVLVPMAVGASYPVVFVAGSVSLALLVPVCRQPGWKARTLFAVYNLLLGASFLANYLVVGQAQMNGNGGAARTFMMDYWAHGFPPWSPLALVKWFALIHTGRLMAYPIGGSDGQSALTFLLFLVGIGVFVRQRRRLLLLLCLTPFALGLIAAFVRASPYGGCCRLSQHVAPIVCLLAGTGAAALIERVKTMGARQRWTTAVLGLFLLVGVVGLLADVITPYRHRYDLGTRKLVQEVTARCGPNDQIVVLNKVEEVDVVLRWELERFCLKGGQVHWEAAVNGDTLRSTGQVWILDVSGARPRMEVVQQCFAHSQRHWVLTDHVPYTMPSPKKSDPVLRCDVYRWICPDGPIPPNAKERLACWP